MILSKNRFRLFGIMLRAAASRAGASHPASPRRFPHDSPPTGVEPRPWHGRRRFFPLRGALWSADHIRGDRFLIECCWAAGPALVHNRRCGSPPAAGSDRAVSRAEGGGRQGQLRRLRRRRPRGSKPPSSCWPTRPPARRGTRRKADARQRNEDELSARNAEILAIRHASRTSTPAARHRGGTGTTAPRWKRPGRHWPRRGGRRRAHRRPRRPVAGRSHPQSELAAVQEETRPSQAVRATRIERESTATREQLTRARRGAAPARSVARRPPRSPGDTENARLRTAREEAETRSSSCAMRRSRSRAAVARRWPRPHRRRPRAPALLARAHRDIAPRWRGCPWRWRAPDCRSSES